MKKQKIKLESTIEELKSIVSSTAVDGEWARVTPEQWRFTTSDSANLHYWTSAGTIHFDGATKALRSLKTKTIAALDKNFEGGAIHTANGDILYTRNVGGLASLF